jgi:hypothetical protein
VSSKRLVQHLCQVCAALHNENTVVVQAVTLKSFLLAGNTARIREATNVYKNLEGKPYFWSVLKRISKKPIVRKGNGVQ